MSGTGAAAGRPVADALSHLFAAGAARAEWQPLPEGASEDEWQTRVVDYANENGWWVYHTHNSKGSEAGFPDLVLLRPPEALFVELKREDGKPTPQQATVMEMLRACQFRVRLWRPDDWQEVTQLLTRS